MKDVLRVMKALSDPTRLRIALLLKEHELCVCELMFILKMEQSRISHQLRILRDAGLVEDKRDGRWMIYGIPLDVGRSMESLFKRSVLDALAEMSEAREDLKALELCLRKKIRKACGIKARQQAPTADDLVHHSKKRARQDRKAD
jgi:ArsR family transcriptional regulator